MRKNKYAVLMSVYKNDNPEFLKTALESIYDNQTVKPDEIVVVFDGPLKDGLYKVLDEFRAGKEDVVKYYPEKVNRGLGEALRIGSELCTCDYILRMDSDDISDQHRFEKQIAYIEAHPEGMKIDTVLACVYCMDAPYIEEAETNSIKYVSAGFKLDYKFISRLKTILQLADVVYYSSFSSSMGYAYYMGKNIICNPSPKDISCLIVVQYDTKLQYLQYGKVVIGYFKRTYFISICGGNGK